ncbi:MAG TPA: hypothetical protein PKC03_00990 [Dokdonella sp.]|jgi:hypothetical protein|nr:hypothetical protein [Dokdonella sp.]
MTANSKTPMALYKANLELVLRIGALLQENRRRWAQLGAAGTSDAIERTLAQAERVLTSNDWSSLSAIPGEDFWKSIRDDNAPVQGTVEAAIGSQAAFAQGLKEAFEAWQQQSADALGGGMALPAANFADFMKSFTPSQAAARSAPKAGTERADKASPATRAKARPKTKARAKDKARTKAKAGTRAKPGPKTATRAKTARAKAAAKTVRKPRK